MKCVSQVKYRAFGKIWKSNNFFQARFVFNYFFRFYLSESNPIIYVKGADRKGIKLINSINRPLIMKLGKSND